MVVLHRNLKYKFPGSNVGSIIGGAWCMLEQHVTFNFFFLIVWAFYGSDLTGFYQSFIKVILKSGSAAGIIEKSREGDAYAQLWDPNSTTLPQSYPASIGSGGGIPVEMWIFWDGRMLNCGLAGISQNVLFSLYLNDTKIEYKKSIFFIVTPSLFWDRIWIRLRIWWRLVKEFFKKTKNWRIYRAGKFLPV